VLAADEMSNAAHVFLQKSVLEIILPPLPRLWKGFPARNLIAKMRTPAPLDH
jgi:hypothetical protein